MEQYRAIYREATVCAITAFLVIKAVSGSIGNLGEAMNPNFKTDILWGGLSKPPEIASLSKPTPTHRNVNARLRLPPGFVPEKHRADYKKLMKVLPLLLQRTKLDRLLANKYVDSLALGLAIIRTESQFKRKARSRNKAHGFWQIKLSTAREVHARNREQFGKKLKEINAKNIFNSSINTLVGALYFKQLLEHPWNKGGSVEWAVLAYNGGPRNVKEGRISAETRAYIQQVLANYKQIIDYNLAHSQASANTSTPDSIAGAKS